jgi:hypothetical protein
MRLVEIPPYSRHPSRIFPANALLEWLPLWLSQGVLIPPQPETEGRHRAEYLVQSSPYDLLALAAPSRAAEASISRALSRCHDEQARKP